MKRTIFALILIVGGAVTVAMATDRIVQDAAHVERWGWALHGEVVASERTGVVVSYSLLGEERLGVARPHEPLSYEVGDPVAVSVLDSAKDRVVIRNDGEVAPMGLLLWLALACLAVLLGVGLILMGFLSTPVAGRFPQFHWTKERHGGA